VSKTLTIETTTSLRSIVALDASPAPGSDWAGDQTTKRARFGGSLNIPRNFFSPSQTMTWSSTMLTSLLDSECPLVSKKATLTRTEFRNFLATAPPLPRHPKIGLIFNHELKPADMSAATYRSTYQMMREEIDASPTPDRFVLVANFLQYQLETNAAFTPAVWRDYAGLGLPDGPVYDVYSEDVYNEDWLGGTDGYETAEAALGGFALSTSKWVTPRCEEVYAAHGIDSAVVEWGADLEAGGAQMQADLYADVLKYADGYRRPGGSWSSAPVKRPWLWVGIWADNAISPVWHDASNYSTHPVAQLVRSRMVESQGRAQYLPTLR
jgi:hypothetical protein